MIPIALTAKNEEKAIGPCLDSLLKAVDYARSRRPELDFKIMVVLDDCTDNTAARLAPYRNIQILKSRGGIVAAQRKAYQAQNAEYMIFADADIQIEKKTLLALVEAMNAAPELQVAYGRKRPWAPEQKTMLARVLYSYNRNSGFQTRRQYFNGCFFAIRDWSIPTPESLDERIRALPRDRFYRFEDGIKTDDIYLSRYILNRYGPEAIHEVEENIFFRPPATYTGMYRTYRRMRREIERLNIIFPESIPVHRRNGVRSYDRQAGSSASKTERFYRRVFQFFLVFCKIQYRLERFWYRKISQKDCPAWKVIEESKAAIPAES